MKKLIIILFLGFPGLLFPQVAQVWVARFNGPGNNTDNANAIAVDSAGNVYVTGRALFAPGSGGDITTIKYNSSGTLLWIVNFDGPGHYLDEGNAIIVDNSGNVYVTGMSSLSAVKSEYVTIKYNSQGIQQWLRTYSESGNNQDEAHSIGLDDDGNVYVTGEATGIGTREDFVTIKYDSSGNVLWMKRYAEPGNGYDIAVALKLDPQGNIFVTGRSEGSGSWSDYATVKYNTSGVEQWVRRYNGPGNNIDWVNDMDIDSSGNVYITGYSRSTSSFYSAAYATIKYNTSGDQLWVKRYGGGEDFPDEAHSIAVDVSGNVVITGNSGEFFGDVEYTTIKYSSGGIEQWVRKYAPNTGSHTAYSVAVDILGYVYVTGESDGSGTYEDYATIKYNSSGVQQWVIRYNSSNLLDRALDMTLDTQGNVYVCGVSEAPGTYRDFATLKYSQTIGLISVSNETPHSFSLSQNYPNPFNPQTKIKFSVPKASFTKLIIYDLLGREVATLVNEDLRPGTYEADWDGSNYSSGVYFYKIITDSFVETKKMLMVK